MNECDKPWLQKWECNIKCFKQEWRNGRNKLTWLYQLPVRNFFVSPSLLVITCPIALIPFESIWSLQIRLWVWLKNCRVSVYKSLWKYLLGSTLLTARRLVIFEGIAIFCISESASQFTILVYRLIKSNLACSNILSSLMRGDKVHRWWIGSSNLWVVIFFRRCNYNEEGNSYAEIRKSNSAGFEISAFRPFPYFLPTFSLAPSFLEVGWQWVGLKWQPYVKNRFTRTQFLCRKKSVKEKETQQKHTYHLEPPSIIPGVNMMAASLSFIVHAV